MSDPASDEVGRLQDVLAGTWSIEREIGRGGMGVVYLARDVSLDRPVAIKVLHSNLAKEPAQRERFLGEARTGARLSHPHLVPIYAVEEREDFVFFVMALIDGESAGDKVRREGPMNPEEAERVIRDIAWGLAYAHAMNLIHRDVTLDNILIERSTGRAVLADFGIASEIDRAEDGPLIGTPAYLAPEIIQGEAPSPQGDLYALGVVAWSLLTGRHPFIADDTPALLLMHVSEPAPPLNRAAPRTPSRLCRAVHNALEKAPSARAGSMEAWIELLQGTTGAMSLADPLRQWLGRWDYAKPFYALGMSVYAMLTAASASELLASVTTYGSYYRDGRWEFWLLAMAMKAATVFGSLLLVHASLEIAALRRLARSGYGIRDIQLALGRHRDELRRSLPSRPSLLARVVHDLGWLAGAFYVLLATALMKYLWVLLPEGWFDYELRVFIGNVGQWAYVAFWSALGFSFLVPVFHIGPESILLRLRNQFWNSSLARGVMRLATIGMPAPAEAPQTLHRPTELVLDLAIEDIWNQLPPTTRDGMSEVPRIVAGLRKRVTEVRDTERLLDNATARSEEMQAIRQRLAQRHEEGVTALERIRLLLARLGSAASPAGEFTQQLQDARAVEKSLLEELGAHRGLLKSLKAGLRTPTLTPTPAS